LPSHGTDDGGLVSCRLGKVEEYYGKDFNAKVLKGNLKVEELDKDRIEKILEQATKDTKKKSYHKTRDAPKLLETIRLIEVRKNAYFCDRLVGTLEEEIGDTI
jgi:hypothetical protein